MHAVNSRPAAEAVAPRPADPRSFEELFRLMHPRVLAWAGRRTDAQTAEDVAGETLVVVWRRSREDDLVVDRWEPWVMAVARRVLANARRAQARHQQLHHDLRAQLVAAPAAGASGAGGAGHDPAGVVAERAAAREAFARLSPGEREAVTLLAWEGRSPAEAAVAARCSVRAMTVRLHRARRHLAAHAAPATPATP